MKDKIIKTQILWWNRIAKSIPLICLAIVLIILFFDLTPLVNRIISLILVGFITVSTVWWWWAMDKIMYLTGLLTRSEIRFRELKNEIKSIKEDVKSLDENNKK
jgi:hypothetical protein